MEFDPLAVEVYEEINDDVVDDDENKTAEWVHQDLAQVKIKVFHGHKDAVKSCSFCGGDRRALTCSHDRTIKLWDLENGVLLNTYQGHSQHISQARPDSTGDRFVSCGWDKKLHVWNVETGRILWSVGEDSLLTCCAFSHDDSLIVCGSDLDHSVKVFDSRTAAVVHHITDLHTSSITKCIFSPKDDRIISSSMDKTTCFWDMRTKTKTIQISGHINIVSDVSISKDEHRMATVSWDKSIALWDIATGAYRSKGPEKMEKAHDGCISSCDITSNGMMVVTGGFDQQVCVWDAENNVQKLRLQGHEDWVEDVCFSQDSKCILSASKDKTLRLWSVDNYDNIPLVMEKRKAIGLKVNHCSSCGKQFSVSQTERSQDVRLCVFCRLQTPDRNK